MRTRLLSGVVFDFDGVIVDTEPLHCAAFQQVLVPLGISFTWEQYMERYVGFDDRDAFRTAFADAGGKLDAEALPELIGAKARAFEGLVKNRGVEPYPGVVRLVQELAGLVPIAICSGALSTDIALILDGLGLGSSFNAIVAADDVAASKPDPSSYSLAVRRLAAMFPDRRISPHACVAIEDTPAGIISAKGAGLKVLALANTYTSDKLGEATRIEPSLEDVSIDYLERLASGI